MFKMELKYDFSGWATRNDLVCADGRTIRRDAFKHCAFSMIFSFLVEPPAQ